MKSPGQKAFEASIEGPFGAGGPAAWWPALHTKERARWERIAAAVTAPEPKSYGQIACESYGGLLESWNESSGYASDWNRAAQAVITEAKRRGDLP